MAIDFPNSPSVNDLYTAGGKTWQWNGTYWAAYGTGPVLRTSDTPPTSPNAGDLWYETDTGRFFTYIDSAWVEIGNATDIAGALQPGQITALSAVTSLTTDDVFPVVDNPSSATATNKITYGNLVTAMSASLAPGLVLVKTQSVGSSVTEAEITSAFSSTYRNYLVTWTGGTMTSSSADSQIAFQLGASNTQYYNSLLYNNNSSTPLAAYGSNQSTGNWIGGGSTTDAMAQVTLYGPNIANHTRYTSDTYLIWNDGGFGKSSGIHKVATAYTSIKLIVTGTGTMSGGTIRVYGYRD